MLLYILLWYRENVRKISLSLQLSDASEYEGGELLVTHGSKPDVARKNRGSITFFPSYIMHEVTPVTKGTRKSIVGWVTGPRWKWVQYHFLDLIDNMHL